MHRSARSAAVATTGLIAIGLAAPITAQGGIHWTQSHCHAAYAQWRHHHKHASTSRRNAEKLRLSLHHACVFLPH